MRIVFTKIIGAGFGKARENITLYHELDANFAPQVGMRFVDGNWSAQVKGVTYDARKLTFICRTSFNQDIENSILEGFVPDPIEMIVKSYLAQGWTDKALV